jgi:hypothetical protein
MHIDFDIEQQLQKDSEDTTTKSLLEKLSSTKKTKATTSCFNSANSKQLQLGSRASTALPLVARAGELFDTNKR